MIGRFHKSTVISDHFAVPFAPNICSLTQKGTSRCSSVLPSGSGEKHRALEIWEG